MELLYERIYSQTVRQTSIQIQQAEMVAISIEYPWMEKSGGAFLVKCGREIWVE